MCFGLFMVAPNLIFSGHSDQICDLQITKNKHICNDVLIHSLMFSMDHIVVHLKKGVCIYLYLKAEAPDKCLSRNTDFKLTGL